MTTLEAVVFTAAVAALAWLLDLFLLRGRAADADTGACWARTLQWWSVICAVLVALTVAREFSDLVSGRIPSRGYLWLGGVWLAIVLSAVVWAPADRAGRWIAGGIGFGNQRYWVAGLAAFLLVPLGYSFGTSDAYDAALWASTVILAVTLLMIALSKYPKTGRAAVAPAAAAARAGVVAPMADWPVAMRAAGIALEALPSLGASSPSSAPTIPPEMQAAVQRLVAAGPMDEDAARIAMIQAPAFCGQEEALTLAVATLRERSEEVTLIITPGDSTALRERLGRRLGEKVSVATYQPSDAKWTEAAVWLVDAATLSQHLLKQLREDATLVKRDELPLLTRVGLIAWWDVHEYSGVRAANLWAISRRLDRLLTVKGRTGLRTLLFAAAPSDATDRSAAFLSHLFPYEIAPESRVMIQAQPVRAVHPFVAQSPAGQVANASVRTGWPTRALATEPGMAHSLRAGMDQKLAESLAPSLSQADASVVAAGANQIANLADLLAAAGRHKHAELPHYVALVLPRNPYIDFLMQTYRERQKIPSQRLLVGAEGHPVLIERHAQLALTEYPDTLAGLRAIFRWDDEVLSSTIRRLHTQRGLNRDAVRFLDEQLKLRRDYLYSNQTTGSVEGSLDTVGTKLIEAKETDSKKTAPAFRVDPERVVIDAYPRRVFFSGGLRYRVEEAEGDFVRCGVEEEDVVTWRGRTARFNRLQRETESMVTRGVKRYGVSGTYREELTDVIELVGGVKLRSIGLDVPRRTEFATRALMLETGRDADPDALQLIALALRCIVPVHVGVDETHLEVLPILTEKLAAGGFATGLALVDLMPGGIGLTEAFQEDEALLRFLIDQAYEWLASCRGRLTAQQLFKDVPVALATGGVAGLRLESAIELLGAMSGKGAAR